ncbi:MAG: prephenate dehydrogenase [Verrucomicrobia bacterium]|jgi:prephenate dehydrogenase|nr:prephenate dehydrogenase [Verrucomicrobiota bacterium]
MQWNKVSLLGLGLLGGSLGKSLIAGNHAKKVVGFVRCSERIQEATHAGVVHEASMDLEEVVTDADLVILCVPVLKMLPITKAMTPFLKHGALVTDVGSVKGPLVRTLELIIAKAKATYIGSHPMAGSEQQGLIHADAKLFKGATCVITPTPRTPKDVVEKIQSLWRQVEGVPEIMDPEDHDIMVARCSHLPHVTAIMLADWVLDPTHGDQQSRLCSTGFKDTTRVASGSPEMWSDILASNKTALLSSLESFEEQCQKVRKWVQAEDHEAIYDWLKSSKSKRDLWLKSFNKRKDNQSTE